MSLVRNNSGDFVSLDDPTLIFIENLRTVEVLPSPEAFGAVSTLSVILSADWSLSVVWLSDFQKLTIPTEMPLPFE